MTENASFDLIKKLGVCLKTKMAEMCLKSVKIDFVLKIISGFFKHFLCGLPFFEPFNVTFYN